MALEHEERKNLGNSWGLRMSQNVLAALHGKQSTVSERHYSKTIPRMNPLNLTREAFPAIPRNINLMTTFFILFHGLWISAGTLIYVLRKCWLSLS